MTNHHGSMSQLWIQMRTHTVGLFRSNFLEMLRKSGGLILSKVRCASGTHGNNVTAVFAVLCNSKYSYQMLWLNHKYQWVLLVFFVNVIYQVLEKVFCMHNSQNCDHLHLYSVLFALIPLNTKYNPLFLKVN